MTTFDTLAAKLTGSLIMPADDRYQKARQTWSGLIVTKPQAVAVCETTADVIETIRYAQAHGLTLSVKGGGHDFAGRALCGGIVLDCSSMKSIAVDPATQTAVVASGNTGGDLIRSTQTHDLIAATGNMSSVGLTGLILGGGYGPIMCSSGLVADNVESFTLVTADGEVVRANEQENPDLYFGLRAGGGNFGCITDFTVRLHPAKKLLAGLLAFPATDANVVKGILSAYTEVMQDAPDALTTTVGFTTLESEPVLYINFVYYNYTLSDGERLLTRFQSFGKVLPTPPVHPVSYFDLIDQSSGGAPFGRNYDLKTVNITSLSEDVIDRLVAIAGRFSSPLSIIPMLHSRGAVTRNKDLDTPFTCRTNHFMVEIIACWDGPTDTDRHLDWVNEAYRDLSAVALPGGYIALMPNGDDDRVQDAFGSHYTRLRELKRKWDPGDVFRSFGHIRP